MNYYTSSTWKPYSPNCAECCDTGRLVFTDATGAFCVKQCLSCDKEAFTKDTSKGEPTKTVKSWFDTDKDHDDL